MEARDCRLYLITPPCIDPASFADELARALDGGDVAALQLRLKGADDDAQRRAADALLPLCKDRDVPLLMNDRPWPPKPGATAFISAKRTVITGKPATPWEMTPSSALPVTIPGI